MDVINNILTNENNKDVLDSDNSNDEEIIKDLLDKCNIKSSETESDEDEDEDKLKHFENIKNNINMFSKWIESLIINTDGENNSLKPYIGNIYDIFSSNFENEFRMELFENIYEVLFDQNIISDTVIFYWKYIVISILNTDRKFKKEIGNLVFDLKNKYSNLNLLKTKHVFKCFIDEDELCYFKPNGYHYYVC